MCCFNLYVRIRFFMECDFLEIKLYHDHKLFQVDGPSGNGLTFTELRASAHMLANGFQSRGLQRGDVICTMVPNSMETVQTILAVPLAGGIISGINPTYTLRKMLKLHRLVPLFRTTHLHDKHLYMYSRK